VEGAAGGAFSKEGGLALVGQAEGGDIAAGEIGFGDGGEGGAAGGFAEIGGIVPDPAGLREVLQEFLLGFRAGVAAVVENDGARRGGALVEREDELPAHRVGCWAAE
jgi:hypothetical protein